MSMGLSSDMRPRKSLTSNSTLSVPFNTRIGNLPVKASLSGFLGRDGNGNNIFMVGSKEAIKPLAFNSILDIKNIVTEYNEGRRCDRALGHIVYFQPLPLVLRNYR